MQLIWLLHNTQLPVADADGMLNNSFLLYRHAIHHEWRDFLFGLYNLRDWRPTAFYLMELPFQMLSGGNQMFTASAITLTCTLISCLYIYRLLRLAIEPQAAALGTILLGLLPEVQWPGAYFAFSEAAFLPAVLASVYHLIRSEDCRNPRHSVYFALATFTAFATRPVESITHLGPVCAVFLFWAWRRRTITAWQIYLVITGAMISISILLLAGWLDNGFDPHSEIFSNPLRGKRFVRVGGAILTSTALLFAGLGGWHAYARWRRNGWLRRPYVIPVFASIYASVVLFYLGFVPALVEWVYATSIGELVTATQIPPLKDVLKHYVLCAGVLPFTVITLLGALSLARCVTKGARQYLLHHPLLYLLGFVPFTLLMTLTSVQTSQRKITAVLCAFLLLMMIPALIDGRWRHLRMSLIGLLVAAQAAGLTWLYTGHPTTEWIEYTIGAREGFPVMVTARPNPHETVGDFLAVNAERHGYKMILAPIITNKPDPIDPFLLGTVMMTSHTGVNTTFPYIPKYDRTLLPEIFNKYGADAFLLISDEERPMIQSRQEVARLEALGQQGLTANDKLADDLLALYADGKLDTVGAKQIDCITITPTHFQACLFEITKQRK